MAHNEWGLLQTLVSCIDDARNDIYVHIDAKVKELPALQTAHAGLYMIEDRIDVRWGDLSVVEAEYALFEAAVANGPYAYYHLLSGADLPLKSQDYIRDFCNAHQGKEFIGYTLTEITPEVVRKAQRWHLFPKDFRDAGFVKKALRASFLRAQELLGIKRNRGVDFKKGSQWVSVTEDMAEWFLKNKVWAENTFHNTFCADEMVMQTLCWNSPYRDNIFDERDDAHGCARAIGWNGSTLVDWCREDYERLASSDALFARKFNSSDMDFIRKIVSLSR